ncbi:MAG: CoA-binding protein [Saprospiraceae bacterium]
MKAKKTLVIGASENTSRYSNMAIRLLAQHGHEVKAIGNKAGDVDGIEIYKGKKTFDDIDTVTLYINPKIQQEYYDYVLSLHPKRIIFNPGTENDDFSKTAISKGIEVENACTLVLLRLGQY